MEAKCAFQSAGCGAFGPAVAGVGDSVRPLPDVPRGNGEDSRDELRATSSGCRVGDLPILRICFELPSVIVGASPALALWSAADGLL
jgi:hypothetical protein